MKITEYKPGMAITLVFGQTPIRNGILLSGICIPNFIDFANKKRYFVAVNIMQDNGIERWWPISNVHKIYKGRYI